MVKIREMLFASLIACCTIMSGCSDNAGNPTGPVDDKNNGHTVLETKSNVIDETGGEIILSSGMSVSFPQGTLSKASTFTISRIDPTTYGEADPSITREIFTCTGDITTFDTPVEVRIPLPEGMTVADSSMVFGGYIDETTGAKEMVACTVELIDGTAMAILPMAHFSTGFMEWLLGETPPSAAGPLTVPYYGQGESKYCWAVSLQMVSQAVNFEKRREITDIIGAMGVDEAGISSYQFRMSGAIASLIQSRTGATPDRCSWDAVNYRVMKDYLKREIGVRGYPVAVHSTAWAHAVVIVGYDGDTFYIHDPASTTTSAIGYKARTWNNMVSSMKSGEFMVCLSVPKSLDAGRPPVTVNLMNGALQFNRPPTDYDTASKIFKYRWDYTNENGYAMVDQREEKTVQSLPGEVSVLKQGGDIEIVNSSRTDTHQLSVWLDVVCLTVKGAYYSVNKQMTLPPNSTSRFTFDDIPVDEFLWNGENGAEYSFIVRAMLDGTLTEDSAVSFTIDPRPVVISSMKPESGATGTEVILKGHGFGAIPKHTTVKFNGIEAKVDEESWSDTQITVTVPENATTGNVVIKNGEIEGEAGIFTVTEQSTVSSTFNLATDWGEITSMSYTASFSLTSKIEDAFVGQEGSYHIYDIKPGTPGTLTLTGSGSLSNKTFTRKEDNGTTTIYTFEDPEMVPLTNTKYEGWPFNPSGDFICDVSDHSVSFTFDDPNDGFAVSIVFWTRYGVKRYDAEGTLEYEEYGRIIQSKTLAIISISGT